MLVVFHWQGLLELDLSHCPNVTNGSLSMLHRIVSGNLAPLVGPHIENSPLAFKLLAAMAAKGEVPFSVIQPGGGGTTIRPAELIAAETVAGAKDPVGLATAAAPPTSADHRHDASSTALTMVAKLPGGSAGGAAAGGAPLRTTAVTEFHDGMYDPLAEPDDGFFDDIPSASTAYMKPPYRKHVDKNEGLGAGSTCFRLQRLRLRYLFE